MSPRGPRSSVGRGALSAGQLVSLAAFLNLGASPGPLRWPEIFSRSAPVELEIGCGNGRFLARAAQERPEACFLGIERSRKYARLAAERLEKHGVRNARVACAVAEEFLRDFVPPSAFAGIHIYFADPWPKRRHAKRRLFQWPLVGLLARAAAAGASVAIKTDVDWHYAQIASLFIEHPDFEIVKYGQQTEFPDEDLQMTGFESKARRSDRPVFFLRARRKEAHL